MKPAAFVYDGRSLGDTLDELRTLGAKVYAMPAAEAVLAEAGIHAQPLGDPLGVLRIHSFGHKEIHLFGFDLCNPEGEGTRICFENRIFFTNPDKAKHAEMLVKACLDLSIKGVDIGIHGDGMFPYMAKCVMRDTLERTLTAVYDMQVSPPTYEVFSFLSQAEKYRAANGFTNIDVVFAPGPMHGFRDDGLPPSPDERASMLHRICVAGARLLPTVRNVHVMAKRASLGGEFFPPEWTNERPRFWYGPRFQKNGHRCLAATQAAAAEVYRRFQKPYATITLRDAEYWPARNSDLAAWSGAAVALRERGLEVIVVPDTHGRARLHGFEEFAPASWDVDLRLALYQGAKLNLGVMNGPMVLCMFAIEECPYLIFQKPDEQSPGTQEAFMRAQGIVRGDNYTSNGWTMWEQDTPENVLRAITDWFAALESKKEVRMA